MPELARTSHGTEREVGWGPKMRLPECLIGRWDLAVSQRVHCQIVVAYDIASQQTSLCEHGDGRR